MSAPIVTGETTLRELEEILARVGIDDIRVRAADGKVRINLAAAINAALAKAGAR